MAQRRQSSFPVALARAQYEWLRNRAFTRRTSMALELRAALQRAMDTEKNDG